MNRGNVIQNDVNVKYST